MSLTHFVLKTFAKIYPLLKSKTGHLNPRVKHTTELGFKLRSYEQLSPGPNLWKKDRSTPMFPAVLQVQTINRCNAACRMCPYPYTTAKEKEEDMSDELWEKIATECAAESKLHVLVPMSKNEPLMDDKLNKRIEFFKKIAQPHQMTEIVTNGDLLNGARMEQLMESGLDMVTISLNATNQATYEKTMQKLSWEKIMKNIREISLLNLGRTNIFMRLIRQKDNHKEVKSFRREWRKNGFNVLIYNINNRSGTLKKYELLLEPKSWTGRIYHFLKRALSKKVFPVCPYAFSMGNILVNGDMPLCLNDWDNREILGNVKEQTIKEIYNSPKVNKLRAMMCENRYAEISPCKNCSLWKNSDWI